MRVVLWTVCLLLAFVVYQGYHGTRIHGTETSETFDRIYATQMWDDLSIPDNGGGSGGGSTIGYTRRTRALVEMLIYKYDIGLLIDAPCGAMKWMSLVIDRVKNHNGNPNFQYVGLDIVKSVIDRNRRTYRRYDDIHFEVKDLSQEEIKPPSGVQAPRGQRVAILSRDALQHLSFNLVVSTLRNYAMSRSDYLIVGSYHGVGWNRNIKTGEHFLIDFAKAPFAGFLPEPLEVIEEEDKERKHMLVFAVKDLALVDFDALLEAARELFGLL